MANFESVVVAVLAMDTEDYIEERVNKKDTTLSEGKAEGEANKMQTSSSVLCLY